MPERGKDDSSWHSLGFRRSACSHAGHGRAPFDRVEYRDNPLCDLRTPGGWCAPVRDGFRIFDAHTHIGDARHSRRTHTAEALLRHMDEYGIERSLVIPFPV